MATPKRRRETPPEQDNNDAPNKPPMVPEDQRPSRSDIEAWGEYAWSLPVGAEKEESEIYVAILKERRRATQWKEQQMTRRMFKTAAHKNASFRHARDLVCLEAMRDEAFCRGVSKTAGVPITLAMDQRDLMKLFHTRKPNEVSRVLNFLDRCGFIESDRHSSGKRKGTFNLGRVIERKYLDTSAGRYLVRTETSWLAGDVLQGDEHGQNT